MPQTRCKFKVDSLLTREYGGTEIVMSPVMPEPDKDGFAHDEDHHFWNATPAGKLVLQITNPRGAEVFQPGKRYYLDFTEVS